MLLKTKKVNGFGDIPLSDFDEDTTLDYLVEKDAVQGFNSLSFQLLGFKSSEDVNSRVLLKNLHGIVQNYDFVMATQSVDYRPRSSGSNGLLLGNYSEAAILLDDKKVFPVGIFIDNSIGSNIAEGFITNYFDTRFKQGEMRLASRKLKRKNRFKKTIFKLDVRAKAYRSPDNFQEYMFSSIESRYSLNVKRTFHADNFCFREFNGGKFSIGEEYSISKIGNNVDLKS